MKASEANQKMKPLKIAENLSLPIDIVTQTVAILAKRRAGKSYTMRRIVEQLCESGQAVFMTGFLENLYRMKAREIYRTPVMLVIDEADAVAVNYQRSSRDTYLQRLRARQLVSFEGRGMVKASEKLFV